MMPKMEVLVMFRSAVGVAACIGTLAGPVSAQAASDVFYNDPDATLNQEIAVYVAMIEQLKTAGQPASGASTFSFTNAAANSPLFDPYLAMQRTVGRTLGHSFCWADHNADVVTYSGAEVIASPMSNTGSTLSHFQAIVDAAQTTSVTFGFTGNDLVSQGIPIEPVTTAITPATTYTADVATMQWISGIEGHAIGVAATFVASDDISHRLAGQRRDVQVLADSIWDHSMTVWGEVPDDIRVLEASFGLFGSLPILAVWFDDGYFLVDGTNGLVSGPFADGVAYDPSELLLNHSEYIPGSAALIIDPDTLCPDNGQGARWRDSKPDGYNPKPATPGVPPTSPAGRPGHWQPYECVPQGMACRCRSTGKYSNPGQPDVPTRNTCICPTSDGPGSCTSQPNTSHPPANPAGCPGVQCRQQWKY